MFRKKPQFMHYSWIKFLASIRFAIPALLVFTVAMIVGTFCESLYGTEYAKRLIYDTPWFYLLLLGIGLSVLLAMFDRIPFRKKIFGFYIVHIALLTILTGAALTHYYGIDGTIELSQNQWNGSVHLNDDTAYLSDGRHLLTIALPAITQAITPNNTYKLSDNLSVKLLKYLPYAKEKIVWVSQQGSWFSSWRLKNDRMEQTFDLFDSPQSHATMNLGPLHFEVLPEDIFLGFQSALTKNSSFHHQIKFKHTHIVFLMRAKDEKIHIATCKNINCQFSILENQHFQLPWMGFQMTLLSERTNQAPKREWEPGTPHKEEAENVKALLVELQHNSNTEQVWLNSIQETQSTLGLKSSLIGPKEMPLPIQLSLDRFKMDLVPGTTDKPASYESFVRVQGLEGINQPVHISMNNPFKSHGYTFYQSSYFQDEGGNYHSVLSVNKDPGRAVKYAGSLLLVFGLMVHFLIIYGYIRVK